MMRLLSIFAVLLLSGCPSKGPYGLTGVHAQDGYTLNTSQNCQYSADATRITDLALVLSLKYLAETGYVKDYSAAVKQARESAVTGSVCLVERPEPCSFGGWTVGPFGPTLPGNKKPLAARKRGCASAWHAWSSICWPPVCRPEWPDEPHCVKAGEMSSKGWESSLIHEVFNMARAKWTSAQSGDYDTLPGLFGPGGVESKMLEAYKSAGYHDQPTFLPSICSSAP